MFYNKNENRDYPFDEFATLKDDSDQWIPPYILADLTLTIPRALSKRAFISAISRTNTKTAIVVSADNLAKTPLAIIDYSNEYLPRTRYGIRALHPEVSGSFIPGEVQEFDEVYDLKFTNPSQSYLLARVVYAMDSVAERDYSIFYSGQALRGLVRIESGGDIRTRIENRTLAGQVRQAVVISLQDIGGGGSNPLSDYAASLPRPENRSCGDPTPVETINGVRPDCCGRIYLELRGCARPVKITNTCGVSLDCPQESDALCPPRTDFDPGPEQQVDGCQSQGATDPLDTPINKPNQPPWWGFEI